MRSVSAAFEAAIAEGGVRLCEIWDVALANGVTYHYTSHDSDLTWNAGGDTYTSLPITRGPIRWNTDGQHDECELTLGVLDLPFLEKIKKHILEAVRITHKLICWDAAYAADEEITLNIWTADPAFDRRSMTLSLKSLLDSLNIMVPRHEYQEPCNNALFDETCGLVRADYGYAGTATAGDTLSLTDAAAGTLYKVDFDGGDSGNPIARGQTITGGTNGYTAIVVQIVYLTAATGTIWYVELSNAANFEDDEVLSSGGDSVTVNGTPAEDQTYWQMGELEMTGGENDGETRPLLTSSGSVRSLLWPMPAAIETGDTYIIYPGCDQRPVTCWEVFANRTPFRGFPFVPLLEETIM